MKNKVKIAVVGIGGVGGYYGGLLSKYAETHPEIEVSFVSRGANLDKMKSSGLKVITETGAFSTCPALVTDHVEKIGIADYIILATKAYDMQATVDQIRPMVGTQTVILPLLNGIDNTSRLREYFPDNEVWYGCVYIVARLNEPGVVESSGNVHTFHFGHEKKQSPELLFMEKLLQDAGIEAVLKENAIRAVWRKYFYISPSASLTSYLNTGFRNIALDPDKKDLYVALMEELLAISKAEHVGLHDSIVDDMLNYGGNLPAGSTSSMNSDYLAGKNTEVESLTGIVVRLGKKHNIPTPVYSMIYDKLKF